jgi:hypothetical protein
MTIHRMSDGTVVNTEKAQKSWAEVRDFDGRNHIGRSGGDQWLWCHLYRSRKGRYYIETDGYGKGRAEWVSNEEAARFLALNELEVPKELTALVEEISE